MTIHRALLLAFLLFSATFAALTAALVYSRSRAALNTEIRLSLETQAVTLTQRIGALVFERVQDAEGWRRLDVMQELKVGDVDKRLARFLHDVVAAYHGTYVTVVGIVDGKVIAASDANLIGTKTPPSMPWTTFDYRGAPITLLRPEHRDLRPRLAIRLPVPDAFGARVLGELQADVDWREVEQLLDQIAIGGRDAALVDREQRPLALSARLRRAATLTDDALSTIAAPEAPHGVFELASGPLGMRGTLVGYAEVAPYKSLPGLGWRVYLLTPESIAFAPVRSLLWSLTLPFGLLMFLAIAIATLLAYRVARPLQELAGYTRAIGRDLDTRRREVHGSREIDELCDAFNRMVEDLRNSRRQLVRASKLAAVGEMAAKLAHEVRTPLGIIRSSAQLVDRQPGLNEAGHEMMSFMINECDRMNQLVTGLLESARPREPVYRDHELHEIVHDVLSMLRERIEHRQVHLATDLAADSTTLRCDRDQIVQVLLNLLMNALQAVSNGGHIGVSTRGDTREIRLVIEDDGPGIPAEARDEIFEPFVSYRAGGIGLGLSIVREIVNLHHGRLELSDSPLGGASVTVLLPRGARGEA